MRGLGRQRVLAGVVDEAAGRLVAEDAVEEGRHADRPADVRAQPERRAARADDGALAARAAADGAARIVGVVGAAVDAVVGLHPHAELGDVGDPERDGARRAQPGDPDGVALGAHALAARPSPEVNGMPASAKLSLMLHGTPWNGGEPVAPARAASVRGPRLLARASSKRWATMALSVGLTRSMCRTCASTTSSEVTSRAGSSRGEPRVPESSQQRIHVGAQSVP